MEVFFFLPSSDSVTPPLYIRRWEHLRVPLGIHRTVGREATRVGIRVGQTDPDTWRGGGVGSAGETRKQVGCSRLPVMLTGFYS